MVALHLLLLLLLLERGEKAGSFLGSFVRSFVGEWKEPPGDIDGRGGGKGREGTEREREQGKIREFYEQEKNTQNLSLFFLDF